MLPFGIRRQVRVDELVRHVSDVFPHRFTEILLSHSPEVAGRVPRPTKGKHGWVSSEVNGLDKFQVNVECAQPPQPPPMRVAACSQSHTGRALQAYG
jgi:hypothetical protein